MASSKARPSAGVEPSIADRASFEFIRYGSVWEDADVLCEALAPVADGGRILSVASAGDNALALLTLEPREIVAADVSTAQLACLELRLAAYRKLEYEELLDFLGALEADLSPDARRISLYRTFRADLSPPAAAFWDARTQIVACGAVHAGKFERYFRIFRRFVLPLVHGRATREELLAPRDLDGQNAFYRDRWNTRRWRLLFRLFFSRTVMGRLGRDPEFFAHVTEPVSKQILKRSEHALTGLPVSTNPYLVYVMRGCFSREALPRYLRREHHAAIRDRLDRVRLVHAPVERAGTGSYDAFNLSDIFEYMSPAEHERTCAALVERACPGARLAYWNLLAPRTLPSSLTGRVRPLEDLASELHARDRAWFYGRFCVDEVVAGT